MALSPEFTHHRARVAGLRRAVRNGERPANDPELVEAYASLAKHRTQDRTAELVDELVATAPPFTDGQRAAISALLRTGGAV